MLKSDPLQQSEFSLIHDISLIIEQNRLKAVAQLNSSLTLMFWQVGNRILNHILVNARATYGKQVVVSISENLRKKYGRNFEEKNLRRRIQFAELFKDYDNVVTLSRQLSWSHFLILLPLKTEEQRQFYARYTVQEQLGVRGLRKGFAFIERQKRMIIDNQDFHLDLLFYHRRLKRLVAIELKIGKFHAGYKGQMELYLKWLDKYEKQLGENAPIGLILCTETSREQVELLEMHKDGIVVAEYWTDLPPRQEFKKVLHAAYNDAKELIEQKHLSQKLKG